MADLKDPRLLYGKGLLFVVLGTLAGVGVWLEHPTWRTALLLVVAIWAFARAYYFAFYVVQHYVDGEYRFAGLIDFFRYVLQRRRKP